MIPLPLTLSPSREGEFPLERARLPSVGQGVGVCSHILTGWAGEGDTYECKLVWDISQSKGVRNFIAVTLIPCLSIVRIASVLSRPPENNAAALAISIKF